MADPTLILRGAQRVSKDEASNARDRWLSWRVRNYGFDSFAFSA